MRSFRRLATGMALCALMASPVWAQTQGSQSTPPPPDDSETRPATTTVFGDTGLWYVPTGEVLPKGRWSFSGYRTNWDRKEAFSDVSNFRRHVRVRRDRPRRALRQRRLPATHRRRPPSGAIGRDADGRSAPVPAVGHRLRRPAGRRQVQRHGAVAVSSLPPLPSAPSSKVPDLRYRRGPGHRQARFPRRRHHQRRSGAQKVELSGFGGFMYRGRPRRLRAEQRVPVGRRRGFPSRSRLRVTTELTGEMYFDDEMRSTALSIGTPARWEVESPADFIVGLTYQAPNGFFIGYGASYGLNTTNRSDVPNAALQHAEDIRPLGQPGPHRLPPGRARLCGARPAAAAATAARAAEPATDGQGAVRALCGRSRPHVHGHSRRVGSGWRRARLQVERADRHLRQSGRTADDLHLPDHPGSVPRDRDGRRRQGRHGERHDDDPVHGAGAASSTPSKTCTSTSTATRCGPKRRASSTKPSRRCRRTATLRLTLEGHTCNIGTTEYNLALGERRSNAVRDYLAEPRHRRRPAQTVSYGEERPKHDNSREETRRLNRRAAMTVRLQ